jgi:hydroxyacylglutathione hydrolase
MILRQYLHEEPVVAASYLLGCGGQGAGVVVDPLDEVELYLNEAPRAEEVRALNLGALPSTP